MIPSERPEHFMMECWNPLGVIGVITAFNFPIAVFGWNLAISMICGNLTVLKGAPSTSLTTVALIKVIQEILVKNKISPAVVTCCQGGVDIGTAMVDDPRIKLVSFTGSSTVGRIIN